MTTTAPDSVAAIRALFDSLPDPDTDAAAHADAREPQLTKPPGALGRLEDIARWLAAWQGRHPPRADRIAIRIFAANHGVTAQGVSAFPADVTAQMVGNFAAGGAAINQLSGLISADLKVMALDLDTPSADFSKAAALSDEDLVAAFRTGFESVDPTMDLLCVGEMGIGNTTSAAAICLALYGGDAATWTGPGTGVRGTALERKATVVGDAVRFHVTDPDGAPDGIGILRRLGGRELAAMAGAIMAGRMKRVPVLLDGYVTGAAAACLRAMNPQALDHCLVGHVSQEPGHRLLLDGIGMRALLDLDMRLGEASGAALAANIVRAAVRCHVGMATFDEAGVSGENAES